MLDNTDWQLSTDFDIFSTYLKFVKGTEPPVNYHRWCLISGIAALLGRKVFLNHGFQKIYPNLFVTFVGEPSSRKSTAIKIMKGVLTSADYDNFAADKTSKEKFLLDLEGHIEPGDGFEITVKNPKYDCITAENIWGKSSGEFQEPKEVLIAADEFSEFMGMGNLEFCTTLGNLWDWDNEEAPFKQRLKNSRSVSIYQPTINILSGTTADLFSKMFPVDAIGSGFLARLILIYGERSDRKIAFPAEPDIFTRFQIVTFFKQIKARVRQEIALSPEAKELLTNLYQTWRDLEDVRFRGYSNRRFTQLLKLCLILTASKFQEIISVDIAIEANTLLTHAEYLMPRALGEFGKSKTSDIASKVMTLLEEALLPLTPNEIFKQIRRDVDNQRVLMDILHALQVTEKIQVVKGAKTGYLPKKQPRREPKYVDWKYITAEERDLAGIMEC